MRHPLFGIIALPLLSRLYVHKSDIENLKKRQDWEFRTKHALALDLCKHVMERLRTLGSKAGFIVVFDGAYAAAELSRSLMAQGAIVVTRFRWGAMSFDVPAIRSGVRGRPRKYGKNRISTKKRAADCRGWQTIRYCCQGTMVEHRYKTILSTSPIFGGAIRVVLLEYSVGDWATYISRDTSMNVEMILKTVSDRWAIEEHFHDVKEIWEASEQQVRNVWSSVGCWNLCG